jgi:NAD(P)-dependent dehydrogenase (short-subunit alcohol dehydrogenase family)
LLTITNVAGRASSAALHIKRLALFLASPASAYITGQEITIDGGWTLGTAD